MPEIPLRISSLRTVSRIATPAIRRAQDPDRLRTTLIAEGGESIADASAGVFRRMAVARSQAAGSQALSEGTRILNEAQQAANESTDFSTMEENFDKAYNESIDHILDEVPDDGQRFKVHQQLNNAFMTRQMDVRQRSVGLERLDQAAKFSNYSVEVARTISDNPNSLTLGHTLDGWMIHLEDLVISGAMDPVTATTEKVKMFDFAERMQIREIMLDEQAFIALQRMLEPGSFPNLTAPNRVKVEEALRIQDSSDAMGSIYLSIAQGVLDPIDPKTGKQFSLEAKAKEFFEDGRIDELRRARIVETVRKARARGITDAQVTKRGNEFGKGPGDRKYTPGDSLDVKAGDNTYQEYIEETFPTFGAQR